VIMTLLSSGRYAADSDQSRRAPVSERAGERRPERGW
jgi:hypothetical protein